MALFIGNIIALIASIIMVYSGTVKEKKKILLFQIVEITMYVMSNLILGGIPGAIMNVFSLIGNILCYFDKLGVKEKLIISAVSIPITVHFNNLGWVGLFPLICILTYMWFMNIKDILKFKYLIIFVTILWVIYDFTIKSYTSGIFDILTIITNVIAVSQIMIGRKKEKGSQD